MLFLYNYTFMDRRDFIRKTFGAGVLASASLSTALESMASEPAPAWDLVAVKNGEAVPMFEKAIQSLGGMKTYIKKGQKVEVTYHFKNTGDKPLIINSVNPGCGCTIAEKPEKPILPGKEDKIVAVFNTESQAVGTQIKQVHVSANTTPATEHTLTFKGEVYE